MQALALLGGSLLAQLGIVERRHVLGVVLPEPGSGRRVTLGGTTSGALSAIFGSAFSWDAALMPSQSKTLPLSSTPSIPPQEPSASVDAIAAAADICVRYRRNGISSNPGVRCLANGLRRL